MPVHFRRRGQVGLRVGDGVEPVERQAGLQMGVRIVERLERLVGRGDALARIAAPDLACRVAVLDREQAGAVVVEERREHALGEGRPQAVGVDPGGVALRDVVVAEVLAHDVADLALDQGVVVAVPRPRLGELDVQLDEHAGDAAVDVLGAGASLRDALSAWQPLISNGTSPMSPFRSGTRKRSEMAGTAPTNSYWVIADRKRSGSTMLTR